MAKRRTTTVTEENLGDEMGLEGWLLELGSDPEIQAVHVWKQNPRGGWTRLAPADLAPPFDGSPSAVFERYGDGVYRFVGIGPRMKFRGGSRDVPVAGYGEGTAKAPAAGPGATPAAAGALEAMRETVDQMRLEVQMASLQRMLDRMSPPAGPAGAALDPAERAVLQEEAFDRNMERTQKMVALLLGASAGGRQAGDPFETVGKVLDLVVTKIGGLGRGSGVGTLKETLELLTVARELLGPGGGEEGWGGLIRDVIRNPSPELLRTIREAILTARGVPPPRPPQPRAVAPAPAAPPGYPPAAPPAPPPAAAPVASAGDNSGRPLPPEHPWEILRLQIIPELLAAAARGDRGFLRYAELIDRLLPPAGGRPGALEEFTQFEFPVALDRLAQLDPRLREAAAAAWLQEFYTYVRDEYFLPEEEAPHGGAGETGGPAAAGTGGSE